MGGEYIDPESVHAAQSGSEVVVTREFFVNDDLAVRLRRNKKIMMYDGGTASEVVDPLELGTKPERTFCRLSWADAQALVDALAQAGIWATDQQHSPLQAHVESAERELGRAHERQMALIRLRAAQEQADLDIRRVLLRERGED